VTISADTAADVVLSASHVSVRFGGLQALNDVSLEVPSGVIVGLIGPNGAGKTTLFGVLSGLSRPDSGAVHLAGKDVTKASATARAQSGIARTFQHPELFPDLTVMEHIALAWRLRHRRRRLWTDLVDLRRGGRPEPDERAACDRIIDMLDLARFANRPVNGLPLGTTRLVEVARALGTDPTVMLLDEPGAGLESKEAARLADALEQIVLQGGPSMLLVEHDLEMVMRLSRVIYVLALGALIAEGGPEEIRASQAVQQAYLGDPA
jgi:ABC-type branched-subunit amino acid transport system ATPase component